MFEAGIDDDAFAVMRRDNFGYLVGVEARLTVGLGWAARRARLAVAIARALGATAADMPAIEARVDRSTGLHEGAVTRLVDALWADFGPVEF